jgi:hypothetical protein
VATSAPKPDPDPGHFSTRGDFRALAILSRNS